MTTFAERRRIDNKQRIEDAAERLAEVLQDPPGSQEGYLRDAAYILGIEGDRDDEELD